MEILEAEALKTYALRIDGATGEVVGQYDQDSGDRADVKLDAKVRRYMIDNNCTYDQAFRQVIADPENRGLVRAYAAS